MKIPGADRIIVALDVNTADQAFALVDRLKDSGCAFKVGLELFSSEGPSLITTLRRQGVSVFVDLKLHDIPNTVAGAARALARRGAWLMTVHVAGGEAMCRAAAEAAREGAQQSGLPQPLVVGITVLTSLDPPSFAEATGVTRPLADEIIRRAQQAMAWGLDGVVASPLEARIIRDRLGPEPLLITPGVRPFIDAANDQARVATPATAIQAGADYLVIGRPIYKADDPLVALNRIADEVNREIAKR